MGLLRVGRRGVGALLQGGGEDWGSPPGHLRLGESVRPLFGLSDVSLFFFFEVLFRSGGREEGGCRRVVCYFLGNRFLGSKAPAFNYTSSCASELSRSGRSPMVAKMHQLTPCVPPKHIHASPGWAPGAGSADPKDHGPGVCPVSWPSGKPGHVPEDSGASRPTQSSPREIPLLAAQFPQKRDQLPEPQIVHYSLLCLKLEFPPPGPTCGLVLSLRVQGSTGPTEEGRGPWLPADTASLDPLYILLPQAVLSMTTCSLGSQEPRPELFLLNWPLSYGSALVLPAPPGLDHGRFISSSSPAIANPAESSPTLSLALSSSILTDFTWTMNLRLQGASLCRECSSPGLAPVTEPGTSLRLSNPPTTSKAPRLFLPAPRGTECLETSWLIQLEGVEAEDAA